MKARALFFEAPYRVRLREEDVPAPRTGEALVESLVSAISAGTELLFYRGQLPEGLLLDESIGALDEAFRYPVAYGYAVVGEVVELGRGVPEHWLGRRVFAFQPHRSRFVVRVDELVPLREGAPAERSALLPTSETAVNLLLDAEPLVGERVLVLGQGVVGLMATALLARFPLESLVTVDPLAWRRERSLRLGAGRALAPDESPGTDFDLTLELSGKPEALNAAIDATGFEGRIVVGSWYGDKRAPVDLGTRFHRGRLKILSSQVSHLGSARRGRWTKARRLDVALSALERVHAAELVSHRFPLERASEAYRLLAESPGECLQILLTYT